MDEHSHKSRRKHKNRTNKGNKIANEIVTIKQQEIIDIDGKEERKEEKEIQCMDIKHKEVSTHVKVPIILASKKIDVLVESIIAFDEPVMNIRFLSERANLTESRLIVRCDENEERKGVLFLKGFIQKTAEYSVLSSISEYQVSGENKNLLINIPFECSTVIEFYQMPIIKGINSDVILEVRNICYEEKYQNRMHVEDMNKREVIEVGEKEALSETIFCELERAQVCQKDIFTDTKTLEEGLPFMAYFQTIREELVIILDLKISQKQNINI
ncbi:MAG: hypothetical protein Q8936_09080 [Bacillota bacterium]|nr:hypothetical protein [Bacillota bacterium]